MMSGESFLSRQASVEKFKNLPSKEFREIFRPSIFSDKNNSQFMNYLAKKGCDSLKLISRFKYLVAYFIFS